MSRDHLTRAALRCEDHASKASSPEQRDLFLLLAQEFRKLASEDAKRRTRDFPKRPPAASVKRRAVRQKRA
jgi:hypothetical protein